MSWSTFLDAAPAAGHAVQVYDDVAELSTSTGRFADAGFQRGEPLLLLAARAHQPALLAGIEAHGWDAEQLRRGGLLTVRDAERLLDALLDGAAPSRARFEQVVGGLVDELSARFPGKTIRAFGEMVDLLWQRDRQAAAIALEELWSELATTRRFALLCGYHLDIFDLEVQRTALPELVRTHTHPRPAEDASRLAAAVDRALNETVGPRRTGQIYLQVAEQVPRTKLPRAQAVLMWLSARDADTARRVLDRTRTHYAA
jgi:hypothetical protein